MTMSSLTAFVLMATLLGRHFLTLNAEYFKIRPFRYADYANVLGGVSIIYRCCIFRGPCITEMRLQNVQAQLESPADATCWVGRST